MRNFIYCWFVDNAADLCNCILLFTYVKQTESDCCLSIEHLITSANKPAIIQRAPLIRRYALRSGITQWTCWKPLGQCERFCRKFGLSCRYVCVVLILKYGLLFKYYYRKRLCCIVEDAMTRYFIVGYGRKKLTWLLILLLLFESFVTVTVWMKAFIRLLYCQPHINMWWHIWLFG